MNTNLDGFFRFFGLFFFSIVIVACPGVSDLDVLRLNDAIGPTIAVSSPVDGEQYAPSFTVSGTVTDMATDAGDEGEVISLDYSIAPSDSVGDIVFGDDGTFSVVVDGSAFLGPQTITLSAEDWNENAEIYAFVLEAPKEITYFAITALQNLNITNDSIGLISGTSITVPLIDQIDFSYNLVADFISTGTLVQVDGFPQVSGVTLQYFGSPRTYTVIANDGTTQDYTVTVLKGDNTISSFSFQAFDNSDPWLYTDVTADITANEITAEVFRDVDVSSLAARFSHSGASIQVGGVSQNSGITINNFSNPVVYTVTSESGIAQAYTVTVNTLPYGYRLAADLHPSSGSNPDNFIEYNSKLYFGAVHETQGKELWQYSDPGGASMVADIEPGSSSSLPQNFALYNGSLFFLAYDSINGGELWKYDEANGAVLVEDIRAGTLWSYPKFLTVYNGILYFQARDDVGEELYQYNGATVSLVADIHTTSSSYPEYLTVYDGKLYFSANDGSSGRELWKFDQTNGASLAADIASLSASSNPKELTVFDGKLLFQATTSATGEELYKYSVIGGASLASDIISGTVASSPVNLTVLNNTLYFGIDEGSQIRLWQYDESNGATVAADLVSQSSATGPHYITAYNNKLYFTVFDVGTIVGNELWVYDESNGASVAADIRPGTIGSYPKYLTVGNGNLFFQADDGINGVELWEFVSQ